MCCRSCLCVPKKKFEFVSWQFGGTIRKVMLLSHFTIKAGKLAVHREPDEFHPVWALCPHVCFFLLATKKKLEVSFSALHTYFVFIYFLPLCALQQCVCSLCCFSGSLYIVLAVFELQGSSEKSAPKALLTLLEWIGKNYLWNLQPIDFFPSKWAEVRCQPGYEEENYDY